MPRTHYEVLDISTSLSNGGPTLTAAALKAAYHRALLRHHPDKNPSLPAAHPSEDLYNQTSVGTWQDYAPKEAQRSHFTVDEILHAYITLSSPSSRAEYDRKLRLESSRSTTSPTGKMQHENSHSGFESIDLDDMCYDVSTNMWWKNCRCETPRAYVVTEGDMERAMEDLEEAGNRKTTAAEVIVPCQGCSSRLRVGFAIEED